MARLLARTDVRGSPARGLVSASAPNGTPQQVAFAKYVEIMNRISRLGFRGFAQVLDRASPEELADLGEAADLLLEHTKGVPG
jgi:hypothetical protein